MSNSPLYNLKTGGVNYTKFKVANIKVRDFIRRVQVNETIDVGDDTIYTFADYIFNESKNEFPELPECFKDSNYPDRGYRGVIKELVQSINSIISNGRSINGIRQRTKKDNIGSVPFESWCRTKSMTPLILGDLKGHFKIGRTKIPLSDLIGIIDRRSFSIHRENNKYYLICPVSSKCLHTLKEGVRNSKNIVNEGKSCNENQVVTKHPLTVLDTGVRTFQTAYSIDHTVELGKEDLLQLHELLKRWDTEKSTKRKLKIRSRITHLVDELHWKTIGFLTRNYQTIVIPEFPVSQMVKGKKLARSTKRLMYTYKFYQFKQRLQNKCLEHGNKLMIVDESYTSKTCGACGCLHHKLGGNKVFECPSCGLVIDRDINGARNILIKTFLSD